jgi:hypothetical protein
MVDEREALRPFAVDAAAVLDRRAAGVRPDFAAMMARVAEIAKEADPLAPVAEGEELEEEDRRGGLAAFTGALRAELDAKVHARSLAGIPPLAGRRRRGAVIGVVVALAAAVVLFVVGPGLIGQAERGRADMANAAGSSAAPGEAGRGVPERAAPEAVPEAVPEDRGDEAVPEDREDGAVPEDREDGAVPEDREDGAVLEDRSRDGREGAARGRAQAGGGRGRGASLEDEAQALWARGELAAAEQKLREVLRVAGGTRRAELAYGDLFALVRQMHGADGQAVVWREYLGKFPDGRFADDARAGLCQRTAADGRAACWRGYLVRHPDGAHRGAAEAALAGGAP